MKSKPASAAATPSAEERAFALMRTQGLRLTPQRRVITRVAFGDREHFSAESLLSRSRESDSRVSRATVYRTLSFLVKVGLIRQIGIGQSSPLYDPNFADHPGHGHFVCVDCHKIVEFQDHCLDVREAVVTKDHGFSPRSVHLQIEATCDAMRQKGVCHRHSPSRKS